MKWHPFPVEEYEFESTGKRLYAHLGILGIDPELERVTDGYDGHFEAYGTPLTPAERIELAKEMIARWRKWGGLG